MKTRKNEPIVLLTSRLSRGYTNIMLNSLEEYKKNGGKVLIYDIGDIHDLPPIKKIKS